ncbi:MAG: TetR/AcrR family transcriptional regulator [Gordonia sp. (in: high G+C Gram-positive bacteria)]
MRRDKQEDLLEGALRVFARDGYTRSTIQALAKEAQVSTRTIYNQYGNKNALFRAVIVHSATQVAEREIASAAAAFGTDATTRTRLVEFGKAWAAEDPATRTHFAMVKQINAEIEHIDPDTLQAWREAGPLRVRRTIADHLGALHKRGELFAPNPELAAVHLVQLTAGTVREIGATFPISEIINQGVDTFLAAYASRRD